MDYKPNPFTILGLPVDTDRGTIVEQGQQLSDIAATEEERDLHRWAVGELLHDQTTRRRHEILEAPGAAYRDGRWASFEKLYANPADRASLQGAGDLRPGDFDLAAIVGLILDASLVPPPVDAEAAVRHVPTSPELSDPPLEVADVLFG